MKSLKYAKKITEETAVFAQLIDSYCTKVNREYMKQVLQLVQDIAEGEGLDFAKLKQKYIKSSRSDILNDTNDPTGDDEVLLDKILYDGKIYYLNKESDNVVYDTSSNIVGKYTDGKIVFTPTISQG